MSIAETFRRIRLLFLWLWHQFVTWGLFGVVLLAIYVGIGRQFVPGISVYKPDLEKWLSQKSGVTVRFGEFRGEWHGLTPVVIAEGVTLRSPLNGRLLMTVPEARLVPELASTVLHLEPRVRLSVAGIRLGLEQQADSSWQVREFSQLPAGDAESAKQALQLVLRQPLIQLERGELSVRPLHHPEFRVVHLEALLTADGDDHGLQGDMQIVRDHRALPLKVGLLLNGDPLVWRKAKVNGYLKLPETELTEWWQPGPETGLTLSRARASGEVWASMTNGVVEEVLLRPQIRQLESGYGGLNHQLTEASGLAVWRREGAGWALSLSSPQGHLDGVSLSGPGVMVGRRSVGGGLSWRVVIPRLSLGAARQLAERIMPADMPDRSLLSELSPSGDLQNVDVEWLPGDKPALLAAHASFNRLSASPVRDIPGFQGISGDLVADSRQGVIRLDSASVEVNYPQQFRERLLANHLAGAIRIRRGDAGWSVESSRLALKSPDANGVAALRLAFPDNAPATMNLAAILTDGRAGSAWKYVPWPSAGQETLDWLQHALTEGAVSKGWFFYDGPLSSSLDHQFQMHFQLAGATLDYQKGWPPIRDLSASVDIDMNRISVSGASGRVYEMQLSEAVADITQLSSRPELSVSGQIKGPASDVLRLFRESPLRSDLGDAASDWKMTGNVEGQLGLSIPLVSGEPSIDVEAKLAGNSFDLVSSGLRFGSLSGGVRFSTGDGLQSDNLTGVLFGRPVAATIQSQARKGSLQRVQINVAGKAPIPALAQWAPSSLWQHFQGESAYKAEVQVLADGSRRNTLAVTSDLTGVRCTLPAPLGKTATESLPLRYTSTLGGAEQFARLGYAKRFGAALVWKGSAISRAALRMGSEEVGWPLESGIAVDGKVARLVVEDWQKALLPSTGNGIGVAGTVPEVHSLELDVKDLQGLGYQLKSAHIKLTRNGPSWQLGLRSDRAAGSASWPEAGITSTSPLVLHLDTLQWPLASGDVAAGNKAVASVPNMDLSIDELTIPGLGRSALKVKLRPDAGPVRMEDVQWQLPGLKVSGRADWTPGRQTRFQGALESQDLTKVFTLFDLAPTMAAQSAKLDADVSWSSDPWDLRPESFDGKVSLRMQSGRLLSVSNAASATRVVGLFNFANLGRRFKLDFSDLTQKGVAFDDLSASAQLRKGLMDVSRYELKGPAISAQGSGSVNLSSHALDMQLAVTVPVTRVLPIAAAVVAGPIIGGAVLAAQAVLNRPLEKLTTVRYQVGGTWDDPDVKLLATSKGAKASKDAAADGKKVNGK